MATKTVVYRSAARWLERSGWDHGPPLTMEQCTAGDRSKALRRFKDALVQRYQDEADQWASKNSLFSAEGTTQEYAHRCVAKMTQIEGANVGAKLLPQVAQAKAMPKSDELCHMPTYDYENRINRIKQQKRKLDEMTEVEPGVWEVPDPEMPF